MRMTILTKPVDVQEAVGVLALIDEANCSWQQTVLFQSLCPGSQSYLRASKPRRRWQIAADSLLQEVNDEYLYQIL